MLFPSNFHKAATNCDVCGLHRRGSHFKIVQAFTFWNTVLRTGQLRKIRKTLKMLTTKMSTKSLVIHGPRVERLKIRIRVNKIRFSVCVCARTWARRRRDTDNVCCTAASALTTVRCCDFIREKSDGRKKKSSVCCSRTSADTCHCREGEKKNTSGFEHFYIYELDVTVNLKMFWRRMVAHFDQCTVKYSVNTCRENNEINVGVRLRRKNGHVTYIRHQERTDCH